jgi:hypothetical protein
MEFSNQMETLEKKAGETAAAVKAAAAASRLHSMTIDADRRIRRKSWLSGAGIDFHGSTSKIMMSPRRSSPRSTTTISPCPRSSSGMDQL